MKKSVATITIVLFMLTVNIIPINDITAIECPQKPPSCLSYQQRFDTNPAKEPELVDETATTFTVRFERTYQGTFYYNQQYMPQLPTSFTQCSCQSGTLINNEKTLTRDEQRFGLIWKEWSDGSLYGSCTSWNNNAVCIPQSDPNSTITYWVKTVGYYKFDKRLPAGTISIQCPETTLNYIWVGMLEIKGLEIRTSETSATVTFYTTKDFDKVELILGRKANNELYWFKSISGDKEGRAVTISMNDLNQDTVYFGKIMIDDIEYTQIQFKTEKSDSGTQPTVPPESPSILGKAWSIMLALMVIVFLLWITEKIKGTKRKPITRRVTDIFKSKKRR